MNGNKNFKYAILDTTPIDVLREISQFKALPFTGWSPNSVSGVYQVWTLLASKIGDYLTVKQIGEATGWGPDPAFVPEFCNFLWVHKFITREDA